MAFVGLIMFLLGFWGLKTEYFGEKWRRGFSHPDETEEALIDSEDPNEAGERYLERNLHIGIIKTWGCFISGAIMMLLFPWSCGGS